MHKAASRITPDICEYKLSGLFEHQGHARLTWNMTAYSVLNLWCWISDFLGKRGESTGNEGRKEKDGKKEKGTGGAERRTD